MQAEKEEVAEAEDNSGSVAQDMMEMDIIDDIINAIVCAIVVVPPKKYPHPASKRAKPPSYMMTVPELSNHLLDKKIAEMETMLVELSKKTRVDFVRLKMLKRARGVDNEPFLKDVQSKVAELEQKALDIQAAHENGQPGGKKKKAAPQKRRRSKRKGW